MKINTITCHDVYNLGAGLQAYALAAYLRGCGHDVQILDYKPDYLSRHYSLTWVSNPKYDRPLLRQAYLLAKLPGRLKARRSLRKRRFDAFRQQHLPVTAQRYDSCKALKAACLQADAFIAGSDQIWNPVFPNGKDPAFFLDFVPEGKKRISYAASFAVDSLSDEDQARMKPWLEKLDSVSVRESSGVSLLAQMGIQGEQVMDPVFLLDRAHWENMAVRPAADDYILVYDFDQSPVMRETARRLSAQCGKRIVSVFPMEGADEVWQDMGPLEFLGAVQNAAVVLSNSFHATAFSLIFERPFYVLNRTEKINTRMQDLLGAVGLQDRLVSAAEEADMQGVNWSAPREKRNELTSRSREYLMRALH